LLAAILRNIYIWYWVSVSLLPRPYSALFSFFPLGAGRLN